MISKLESKINIIKEIISIQNEILDTEYSQYNCNDEIIKHGTRILEIARTDLYNEVYNNENFMIEIIKLVLADKIITTQEEQFKQFEEELKEFYYELNEHYSIKNNKRYQNARSVIDEGIDVCKSLQKYLKSDRKFKIFRHFQDINETWICFEVYLHRFQESLDFSKAESAIEFLLEWLFKFCKENDLDFNKELFANDKKNYNRGYCEL